MADITEFDTDEGRLYLAGVLDLFGRRIVGWPMGPRRNAELVVDALAMAIARREPPAGVIHHADLGSQTRLNRWSQHRVVEASVGARREPRRVSSNRARPQPGLGHLTPAEFEDTLDAA